MHRNNRCRCRPASEFGGGGIFAGDNAGGREGGGAWVVHIRDARTCVWKGGLPTHSRGASRFDGLAPARVGDREGGFGWSTRVAIDSARAAAEARALCVYDFARLFCRVIYRSPRNSPTLTFILLRAG